MLILNNAFSRTALLVGDEGMEKLKNAKVAVLALAVLADMLWRRLRAAVSEHWS